MWKYWVESFYVCAVVLDCIEIGVWWEKSIDGVWDYLYLRYWLEEDGIIKEIELGRERGENRVLNLKEDGNFEKKVMF